MRISRGGLTALPAFLLGLLLVLMVAGVSASTDTNNDAATTAANTAAATTGDSLPALTTASSSESSTETSTSASDSASSTSGNSLPALSTTAAATTSYNYPTPSVPPTENAPYMRKSKAPEGTVFIAVGAALGFCGLVILAWRGMVAWSVNRSVRKAAWLQARSEKKALLAGRMRRRRSRRRSTMYSQAPGSTMSMEKLGTGHRSSQVPPIPKSSTRTSGLFYSPTAGGGMQGHTNRASNYLPAGYYASSNTAVDGSSVGLSNLGPQSQGYTRTGSAPSPPASPLMSPHIGHNRSYRGSQAHISTTSLNVPPQGRAPSTYLEDLFDSHTPGSDMERR
ncbi:hypothetical protein DTO164E3_6703 [Paecilomyces variotii]|nr:hypothetical protein DTO164E3_6703 [Paecilomyces variotii]KAJ9401884.1 hypothetical protein DTO282F9_1174 [Paecilomyces variotii]